MRNFANKNYQEENHYMDFRRTIINSIQEFTENTKKQLLNEIKEKELKVNKHLSDAQENTNIRLM